MEARLEALDGGRPSGQAIEDDGLVVVAIVLGAAYGVVSRCCYEEGREVDEYSEVVFRPDLLFEPDRLKGWATAVGRAVGGVILYQDWNGCESVVGTDFGMFHSTSLRAGRQYSKPLKRNRSSTEVCSSGVSPTAWPRLPPWPSSLRSSPRRSSGYFCVEVRY